MSKKTTPLEVMALSASTGVASGLTALWCKLQDNNVYILNSARKQVEEAIVANQIPELFAKGTFVLNDEGFTIGAAGVTALAATYTLKSMYKLYKGQ